MLFKKIDAFYKAASNIKVSDSTFNSILEYVISNFCNMLYQELSDDLDNKKLHDTFVLLKRLSKSNIIQLQKTFTFVEFEYLKDKPNAGLSDIDVIIARTNKQRQSISETLGDTSGASWTGLWSEIPQTINSIGTIYFYVNINNIANNLRRESTSKTSSELVNILIEAIRKLKITVFHELQHASQRYIEIVKNKSSLGLPPIKTRDTSYDPYGRKIKEDGSIEEEIKLPHNLRDNEFYTNLTATISRLKYKLDRNFKKSLHKYLIPVAIGLISPEEFIKKHSNEIDNYLNMYDENMKEKEKNKLISKLDILVPKEEIITNKDGNNKTIKDFLLDLKENQPNKFLKAVSEIMKALS